MLNQQGILETLAKKALKRKANISGFVPDPDGRMLVSFVLPSNKCTYIFVIHPVKSLSLEGRVELAVDPGNGVPQRLLTCLIPLGPDVLAGVALDYMLNMVAPLVPDVKDVY